MPETFEIQGYLEAKKRESEYDPYKRHAFNQVRSDSIAIDRYIPDTRHYK